MGALNYMYRHVNYNYMYKYRFTCIPTCTCTCSIQVYMYMCCKRYNYFGVFFFTNNTSILSSVFISVLSTCSMNQFITCTPTLCHMYIVYYISYQEVHVHVWLKNVLPSITCKCLIRLSLPVVPHAIQYVGN